MTGTTIIVSNVDELHSALSQANGGDEILLESGSYSNLTLVNKYGDFSWSEDVTLRSADPDAPAVIENMTLNGVENLIIEDVVFDYTQAAGEKLTATPFRVLSSTGVEIRNSTFHGDDAEGMSAIDDGYPTGIGLYVVSSTDVTLTDSLIEGFYRGALFSNSDDVVVTGNELVDLRCDGFDFTAVQGVLIEGNNIHDFRGSLETADHRDMIQFWTAGTDRPSTDVIIRDNILNVGEGTWTQTIFMNNELVADGAGEEMFYRNFLIEENVIVNGQYHGITMGVTDGLVIRNNTILREGSDLASNIGTPTINVVGPSQNVTIVNNVTSGITGYTGQEDWNVDHNLIVSETDPLSDSYVSALFVNAIAGNRADLTNIQAEPGGVIETGGYGATKLLYDDTPDAPTAIVSTQMTSGNWSSYDFDSTLSGDVSGAFGAKAQVTWDFGDGEIGVGAVVSHHFSAPGTYEVAMRITLEDGSQLEHVTTVEIGSAKVLSFDNAEGQLVLHKDQEKVALDAAIASEDSAGHQLSLSRDIPAVEIDPSDVAGMFESSDFCLSVQFSAVGEGNEGGIVRLYNNMILRLQDDGSLWGMMTNDDGTQFRIATAPIPDDLLAKGVDADLYFDGQAGVFGLRIDGEIAAETEAWGKTPAQGNWGLYLGEAYGYPSATVEISKLDLVSNTLFYPEPVSDVENVVSAMVMDSFDFNDALEVMTVHGNLAAGESGVQSADKGDWAQFGPIAEIEDDNALSLSLSYARDEADGSTARLIWSHMKIGIEIYGEEMGVRIGTADGAFANFKLGDLGLNDTDQHQVIVNANGDTDVLEIWVDDVLIVNRNDVDLQLEGTENGWTIGDAYGRQLNGVLSDFEIISANDPLTPDDFMI